MHDHWTANSTLSMNQVVSDDALASCLASRSMGTHHVMWHIMWHVMWHDVRSGVVGPPARRHPLLPSFSLGTELHRSPSLTFWLKVNLRDTFFLLQGEERKIPYR